MAHRQSQVAVVIGTTGPVVAVTHYPDDEREHETDSGFLVFLADHPDDPDEITPNDPRATTRCLHCLIDQHPEVGRGFDLARQHGLAERDTDGEWTPA